MLLYSVLDDLMSIKNEDHHKKIASFVKKYLLSATQTDSY
jgi:hypothetical protein